uniref:Uncharacterized protein n=1 Tax=Oryza sativa subsp. japonica TaxID=39947 RepID=Q6Z9A9_ORYSJ|nr:hypothetical protein [Oryza sativa Japonica Group]
MGAGRPPGAGRTRRRGTRGGEGAAARAPARCAKAAGGAAGRKREARRRESRARGSAGRRSRGLAARGSAVARREWEAGRKTRKRGLGTTTTERILRAEIGRRLSASANGTGADIAPAWRARRDVAGPQRQCT